MKKKEQYYLYRLEKCENNIFKIIKYNTKVSCDSQNKDLFYVHYPDDNEVVSEELFRYNEQNNFLGDKYDISFARSTDLTIDEGIPVFLIGCCDNDYCLMFETKYNNEYLYGYFPSTRLTIAVLIIIIIFVLFCLIVKHLFIF